MVDRMDIDALLIGSLYGELTAADEVRLQAHLESHPADRTALADLAKVRSSVRDSRILQFQFEPPQSVSALLLQEAARRAPRHAAPAHQAAAGGSWFQRFVRSFAAHPAMAAAAMVVVVLGAAGLIYLRGEPRFAERTVDNSLATGEPPPAAAAPGAAPAAGSAYQVDLAKEQAAPTDPRGGLAQDEGLEQPGEAQAQAVADSARAEATGDRDRADKGGDAVASAPAAAPAISRAPAKIAADPAKARKPSGPGYLEMRTAEPKLKDFDDAEPAPTTTAAKSDGDADHTQSDRNRPSGGAGAGATTTAVVVADRPAAPAEPKLDAELNKDARAAQPGRVAPPPPAAPAPSTGGIAATRGEKAEEGKQQAAEDVQWARGVHSQIVAQVKSQNCRDAAASAIVLSARAPGYYAQNVETDRSLKPCVAYISQRREAEAERVQRARANQRRPADEASKSTLRK